MSDRSQLRFLPQVNTLECRTVPSVVPKNALVIGASAGSEPFVVVIDPNTNKEAFRFMPFEESFRGGVSVAVGDVVGDETQDIVVAAASNGGPRVAIYDGATGEAVKDFYVYEPTFTGGVTVAIGDVNGDGANDLVTGTGTGGGPRVVALDVETGNTIHNFFAFEDSFRGGVNVGSDDVDGDGTDDIVVGTGVGGGPRVTVFDGDDTGNILLNFFAYDSAFRNGVNVSAADMDGDGKADILIGSGTGGSPHVRVISGADGSELENFFAFDESLRGGARVAAVDTDGDDEADTLVVGTPGHLRRFFKDVNGSEIAEDIKIVEIMGGGVYVDGAFKNFGRGHGKGGKGGDHGDDDVQPQTFAGTVEAVNVEDGTITVRTGPTDTLAVFTVEDDTLLQRDGEDVEDLSTFAEGDIVVVRIGSDREVDAIVAVSDATGETVEPSAGRTIEGALVASDETEGTLTVLSRNGTLYLVETDADTEFERYGDDDVTVTEFLAGDLVEIKIGDDGVADKVEAIVSVPSVPGTGDDDDDDDDDDNN